jgi:probable rRNA maturation factor
MIEVNNTTKNKINTKLIKEVAKKFLASRQLSAKDVSIAFIGDAKMRELNRRYRKLNKTTDVLSFTGDGDSLGEIIISPAQIKRQAKENGNSFQDELIFILVHGLLHLAGYDDRTGKDRLKMIKIGEEFVKKLDIGRRK